MCFNWWFFSFIIFPRRNMGCWYDYKLIDLLFRMIFYLCWYFSTVLKECDNRKHGQDCQYDCGKCKSMKHCHHVSGACLSGCEPGFKGEKCVERKYTVYVRPKSTELWYEINFQGPMFSFSHIISMATYL
jgi:hypothetical protein